MPMKNRLLTPMTPSNVPHLLAHTLFKNANLVTPTIVWCVRKSYLAQVDCIALDATSLFMQPASPVPISHAFQ